MLSGTKLAGSNSKRGRVENDFYATNPKAVEMLLSNNEFKKWFWKDYNNGSDIELLEPCVGQGHIIQGIKSYYNNKNLPIDFTCLDVVDRGYDNVIVQDFMEYDTDKRFDCIMTNPPYEIAMEFAQKGMELLKPNGKMCMFLKIQFLEGRKRREFFNKYPPRYIYVFEKRMGTWRNGEEFEEIIDDVDNISVTDNYGNIREIVCKIDMSAFHKRIDDRRRASQLKKEMDKKVKELQGLALYKMMAENSPELKAMLSEYEELTNNG